MGGKWRNCLGLLLTLVHLSYQEANQDYYIGAVVEHEGLYVRNNAEATLKSNADVFVQYAKEASEQGADIIVLPEYGVTSLYMPFGGDVESWLTVIPSAEEKYVPCTGNRAGVSKALKQLSCGAKDHRIYMVVNIAEKLFCNRNDKKCPARGAYYYNSNVVFDRNGQIIARYRKLNLFMEDMLFDVTEEPELVTFDTDFGVTFGTFVCFDILFPTPALNLTRQLGVQNFVYPVAWGSEVPFLTAPQVHGGWAHAENVNLLTSGYHNARGASSGSGIYAAREGIHGLTYAEPPTQKLLISRIRKTPKPVSDLEVGVGHQARRIIRNSTLPNIVVMDKLQVPYNTMRRLEMIQGLNMQWDYISAFANILLDKKQTDESVCYGSFCCRFNVEMNASPKAYPKYRAVVYEGPRLYGEQMSGGIRACGLIQCASDSILSCGGVDYSDTVFTKAKIETTMNDYPSVFAFPTTLNATLYPFQNNWTYKVDKKGAWEHTLSLTLDKPMKDIVTFGIYVRDFDKDEWVNLTPRSGGPNYS